MVIFCHRFSNSLTQTVQYFEDDLLNYSQHCWQDSPGYTRSVQEWSGPVLRINQPHSWSRLRRRDVAVQEQSAVCTAYQLVLQHPATV